LKARASLDEIDRQIIFAGQPARPGLIAAAEAGLDRARATRDLARIEWRKHQVYAPVSGSVEQIFFREGETINAGQPVISLLPPASLKVLFFVPEARRAALIRGQKLKITCDGCPAGLTGRISFISREAEYTPPVIFGPKTREKLVFRIEARLEPPARFLSPGQPVTVHPPALRAEAD
ncbi:MAG TPA: HlyD family efflux transporter periplasmic adaptor subunit, partial [Rhodobacteraceae bacterium]|nr:HlyD family efflux transporter periplasmic adaptor subunit [Paracoccaceae bacterium]